MKKKASSYFSRRCQVVPLVPGEEGDVIARLVEEELYGSL